VGGTVIGVLAGYVGGVLDKGVSEFINVFLAFPPDVVGILVLVAFGGGYVNTALAIGIAFVPRFARLARASTEQVIAAIRSLAPPDYHVGRTPRG